MADVTVHHLEHSRSTRILWLLEELGVEFEMKTYKRHPKTFRAGPELKAVHPLGRSPIVEVDGVNIVGGTALDNIFPYFKSQTAIGFEGSKNMRSKRSF